MPDVVNRLVDFILSILGLFQAWVVVNQFEGGVRLRLGKYRGTLTPGFHLMFPLYIDRPITIDVVSATHWMEEQSLTTKDRIDTLFSLAIKYTIPDPAKFLLDVEDLETVFLPIKAEMGELVRGNSWADLQGIDIPQHLLDVAVPFEFQYGVKVQSITVVDMVVAQSLRLLGNSTLQSE